ncbi:MAG: BMP family ABC transporter substrate-binding protein [Gaiellales bacterium]|nr:BMP family ABC transporter substrate-binding protein [Gaiellales bacterium]
MLTVSTAACGSETTTTTAASTETTAAPTESSTTTATSAQGPFTFGMLLVGPYNDRGYSQAHYDAGLYVEENLPGAKMVYIDKVNTADRPGTTPAQLAEELLAQGATFIIFNSDDMKDGAVEFAKAHPDIPVLHASGDSAWKEGTNYADLPNLGNVMGGMEYGKMIAGAAAALTTQTGQIGYLGPLINDETRRLAASAYLGAKYTWTEVLKKDAKDLHFKVNWIGFWFNIPGVTSDPTQVADDFFNQGCDVVISGIDTTEALIEAAKFTKQGKQAWAIPYDFSGAPEEAPEVALGVPYFNWGPSYLQQIKEAKEGTWAPRYEWLAPDWKDINDPDSSAVGFIKGDALSAESSAQVDAFIAELAGGLNLWTGPLNLQDGTEYLKDGEAATEQQIWYLPQLLEGMEGQSVAD